MGNNRGSKYSVYHKTLTKKDKAFWDYYQEDMGTKDLPTFIDFVLETTGLETISYVGHSEGTTQLFLGGAVMPDYFKPKINLAIMLAPVARTSNIGEPYSAAAHQIKTIELTVVDGLGIYNWIEPLPVGSEVADGLCSVIIMKAVCKAIVEALIVPDVMNVDRFPVAASDLPSG